MRSTSGLLVALLVATALGPSQAALVHLRQQPSAAETAAPAPPTVGVVQAVGGPSNDAVDTIGSTLADPTGNGKMLMNPTDIIRMMMCWGRPKLLDHEKCKDWMAEVCRDQTTGQGYCRRTKAWAVEQCQGGKERACVFASKMGGEVPAVAKISDHWPEGEKLEHDSTLGGNNTPGGNLTAAPTNETQDKAAPKAPAFGNATGSDKLPEQGFDEQSKTMVRHVDMKSGTSDWGEEWPMSDETEAQSTARICREQPWHPWCKLWLEDRERRKPKPHVPSLDAPGKPGVAAAAVPWLA